MRQLFRELKRRNVYKVAVTYAAVAFVTFQAARLIFPATTLEGLYDKLVVLAFVGFPIALVIAWAFELTPEGVQRTSAEADEGREATSMPPEDHRAQSRLAMKALVGLGLVGAAVAGGWYLMGGGGEPSAETATTIDTASTEPRLGDRSIAVLPFEALGQQEPDAFTEGMHDDLLARLSNVSGLKVISRTAVEQYQDTDLSTGDIADSLGVRWVLEGGVQEMGDQIQVNAQLIDPRTETHAWAEIYQRDLTAQDLFALQGEITKKIARSLEAELTPQEAQQVERRPTGDLDAYKLYVQGRRLLDRRTGASIREATDLFGQALREDSTYALAWSGLADARGLYPYYGPDSVGRSLSAQERAARRAVELAPDLAEARASLGYVFVRQSHGPAALRELQRAVELKPSYDQAHHWLGTLQLFLGRPEAARAHLSLAVELNPSHWNARSWLVITHLANGDHEKALEEATRGREMYPARESRFSGLEATALLHLERWDEVEGLARNRLEEGGVAWHYALARIAAVRGDTAAAREHLAELRKGEVHLWEGFAHAALGEADAAFSAWDQVERRGGSAVADLRYLHPDMLAPLRADPRYRELIQEINQLWGLNPDGSLPDSVDVSSSSPADD